MVSSEILMLNDSDIDNEASAAAQEQTSSLNHTLNVLTIMFVPFFYFKSSSDGGKVH